MNSLSAATMARALGPGMGVTIRTPRDLLEGGAEWVGGAVFRGEELEDIIAPIGSYEDGP